MLNFSGGHSFVVHRFQGAQEGLASRLSSVDEPLNDTITTVHAQCSAAIGDAFGLSETDEQGRLRDEDAQRLIGKTIVLRRLERYPNLLRVMLGECARALALIQAVPEHVRARDVELVFDTAESSPLERGYELIAPPTAQKRLLRKAIRAGRVDAKVTLALQSQSVNLMREAARAGNLDAQFEYAKLQKFHLHGVPNAHRSELDGAASQGHPEAQFQLAALYFRGDGAVQDLPSALNWYRKAADQGHTGAEGALGGLYAEGRGVVKNHTTAAEWFRKAAESGLARAQLRIAKCYLRGEGVPQDAELALYWFRRAAKQNFPRAQLHVGLLQSIKPATSPDAREGFTILMPLAELGYPLAQARVAEMLESGHGTEKNMAQAVEYYKKAAAQHARIAGRRLAELAEAGILPDEHYLPAADARATASLPEHAMEDD